MPGASGEASPWPRGTRRTFVDTGSAPPRTRCPIAVFSPRTPTRQELGEVPVDLGEASAAGGGDQWHRGPDLGLGATRGEVDAPPTAWGRRPPRTSAPPPR
jgi:hypothetical protein